MYLCEVVSIFLIPKYFCVLILWEQSLYFISLNFQVKFKFPISSHENSFHHHPTLSTHSYLFVCRKLYCLSSFLLTYIAFLPSWSSRSTQHMAGAAAGLFSSPVFCQGQMKCDECHLSYFIYHKPKTA